MSSSVERGISSGQGKEVSSEVNHTGNGVIESLLGEETSLVGLVHNLIVEDGEVEGQTQADGMGGSKIAGSNGGGLLVSLQRSLGGRFALVTGRKLGKIAVVVASPRSCQQKQSSREEVDPQA